MTGWNLLSSALSFSINFLYSSVVVAPIVWSSPRARYGLSISAGLVSPFSLPAWAKVWISSINTMIFPLLMMVSMTSLSFSSICPRYFVPAIKPPISKAYITLSFSSSGTSPLTMACAKPSTTAVLPTPASPISTGLFLVLRHKISIIRWISSSLPITGSSLCCFAFKVMSLPISKSFSGSSLPTWFPSSLLEFEFVLICIFDKSWLRSSSTSTLKALIKILVA